MRQELERQAATNTRPFGTARGLQDDEGAVRSVDEKASKAETGTRKSKVRNEILAIYHKPTHCIADSLDCGGRCRRRRRREIGPPGDEAYEAHAIRRCS